MNQSPSSLLSVEGPVAALRRFFHSEEVPFGLALVRIVFPWPLICAHISRWPYTREIFSTDGANSPLWFSYGMPGLLPEFSGEVAVALHTALLFFLVTASIGWCSRLSLICSTVLFTYFNCVDCVSTIAKYSCIATHVLLILSMSPCGMVWSVDAWLKGTGRRRDDATPGEPSRSWPRHSMWACRLLQLSLCAVYFGAAITKIKTPNFVSGDQLISWLLSNVNYEHTLGDFLAMHPGTLVVLGYVTLMWEVLWPFSAWRGWGRLCCLGFGLVFHFMTLTMLGLTIFPAVVCPIYFSYLREEDFRRISWWCRRFSRRYLAWVRRIARPAFLASPQWRRLAVIPSPALCLLLAATATAAGVGGEHLLDPYGQRRPEGPYELNELSPERVAELMTPAGNIVERDVFFTMDVGSIVLSGVLLDRRENFHYGDELIAQCLTVPPHLDMWVECNLHDAEDRLVDRSTQIVWRETTRSSFKYKMVRSLAPGDYYLVLKRAGTEITRRRITLLPDKGAGTVASPVAQ